MGNFQSTKKCFLTINSHTPAVKSIKLLNRNFSVAIVLEIKNNSHTLKSHLKKFYLIESGTSTGLLHYKYFKLTVEWHTKNRKKICSTQLSDLTCPKSSLFGSHAEDGTREEWLMGVQGVMGRRKTKGRDPPLFSLTESWLDTSQA